MKKLFTFLIFLFITTSVFSADEKYYYTVALDGSGDFSSIQSAIDACKCFPDQRITIYVKNGIYREKIKVASMNNLLTIKGESVENTIITWDDFFNRMNRGRNSTFYTATLQVDANDFCLENITVQNTAGPVGQAIALFVEGDRCVFKNCRILGHQDTLYASGESSRQYFSHCFIEGTTDFIFGGSTAVFEFCIINNLSDSYITAASTEKKNKYGFVFVQCKLIAADGVKKALLGRPWRDNAKVVYLKCELGVHILPSGWANWDKTHRDQTAFFAEYKNYGPGAGAKSRVAWSKQLTNSDAKKFSVAAVLKGVDDWNPQK